MPHVYVHHRIDCAPRHWPSVAAHLAASAGASLAAAGGDLYGIWRSQIGRPRDELNAITAWSAGQQPDALAQWLVGAPDVTAVTSRPMAPTLRPLTPEPPRRQGNYAFRWFETPETNWDEFLDLCRSAWPGFEASYDSQVIGLWQLESARSGIRESLLLTRRPNLAMWERSKLPEGETEAEVRRKLSRRYDLCDATVVYTTTLLTASNGPDEARWT